jgi:hypothetical protein
LEAVPADIPVVEAAHITWRPLGRLLVAKGLLSEDQLEQALEEQALTGRRLGEILVEFGCVSHSVLSLTLAEQYGIDLTTETGFGTGLRAQIERRQDGERDKETGTPPLPVAVPALALVPDVTAPDPPEVAPDHLHLAQLEEQWAKLADAEERLAESERELVALRRRSKRRRDQAERLIERVWKRDRRIAELSALEGELASVSGTATSESDAGVLRSHLVFAQLEQRYELVERDGALPGPNAMLRLPEICEASFVVSRVGRSPLPNDPRRCAFVQLVHEARA